MAMNAKEDNPEGDTEKISCGYCLRVLLEMEDPIQLPCTHVFCMQCLSSDYQTKGCPFCGASYKGEVLEDLKRQGGDRGLGADQSPGEPCGYKCDGQMASTFCTQCKKAMCAKHEKKHDDLFDLDHDKISIQSYLTSKHKFTRSVCPEHPRLELVMGCEVCLLTFCNECDCTVECKPLGIPGLQTPETGAARDKMSQSRIVRLPKQQGPVTGIRFACPFLLRSPQQNVQTKPSPMMVCDQAATSGLPQACSISSPANIFAPQATVREKTLFNIGTAKMKSTRKDLKEIVRFTSVDGKDSVARDGVSTVIKTKYYCISAMEEYKDLSMEEIRHEAYKTRNNPLRSKPLCFTGGNLFDDEDDNTRVIKQNQYLSSSLHGSRSSPQYDHTGKLAHKLIPIAMLDKLTRQRLDTFVAAAYGKEAKVCKLEKETVKIMEKAERNICNIESYVDFYVNYLCIQLRKRGETFKLQAQQNIKSVTSQGSQMLSELVSERDNLEKSIIDISQIMSSGGTSESITFYKSQLHMIHSLMDRQRQPLKLELKSATMNYSKEMLNGFQDLFRTEAYTPRYLHYLRCVSSASPVIGVCPLNDRRIAVAYEDRLEIRNLHLEEIRHVVCSEFKVVGLATAGEKLLILHRNAANSYEVSMIDIELKNIKKLFNTNLVTSIFSNWQPDIFSNFKRIVITEPATQKLHIYDNEGMRLNCLKLDVSPYTLAIVNKSTLLVNNGIGTKKLNFVVDGFVGWVVHTDSTELQKPKSTQGFSSTALKSKTTAFKFIAQQPNTVVNPTAVNQPNALSTPSEESRANKPHKGQTPETINGNTKQEIVWLSCQVEQLTFGPKQKQFHFAKSGDENGFYYLSQGSGSDPVKDGACIKVFSDEGIVSTLDIMLEDIKDITGIAVSGDKIVIACGAQGLKLFSVK